MLDNGFSEQTSSRDGIQEKMALLIPCSFATAIQVWGRLISGNTRNRGGEPTSLTRYFSSAVIDHFYGRRPDITVAGLYCDYLDRNEQTTSNMLGAMLKQLVGRATIPEDIRRAFEDAKEHFGGVGPRVPELLQMLKVTSGQHQRVVICIDGLDESLAAHRAGLLRALQAIVRDLPNARLFLTGRPFIRSEVESCLLGADTISVSPAREDIEEFLRMKLEEDQEPDAMDESLRADILEIIPEKISEMYVQMYPVDLTLLMIVHRFLLVSLGIETILGETTIRRRRAKLKQMSSGQDVGEVYNATLERIKAQKKDRARLGMEAIMWIAYSLRPLSPDELCQALGVEIGSTDLDNDNSPSIRTILNCGLGLVTVDSSSSKVRLVHFTLQEHILANPTVFYNPHSMIAEVCLTYLNFECIKELSPSLPSLPPTTPFLEYASRYWDRHCQRETSPRVIQLAVKLLDLLDSHIIRKSFLEIKLGGGWSRLDLSTHSMEFTALHAGACLGVLEIMVPLLEINKWDLNATDVFGMTASLWATYLGYDAIVKVLLEREGVDPCSTNHSGNALLLCAAWAGRGTVVQMLLERNDINPDTTDESGRTPLSWATGPIYLVQQCTEEGCARAVTILLEPNDVNPHSTDKRCRTTLSRAAENGREKIIRMRAGGDFCSHGYSRGAEEGIEWTRDGQHEEVVRILLGRSDVNPDRADKRGRTPLSWAAEYGYEESVRMLLERDDVNPHSVDKSGRTPLSWAAENGHEEIVRMLSQRNNPHLNTGDGSGQTPFPIPTENDRVSVVHGQAEPHDTLMSGLGGGLSAPFVSDHLALPEPPPQKTRRFWRTTGHQLSPLRYIRKALSR